MLDYIPSKESLGFVDEVNREMGLYKFMGKVRIGLGKFHIPLYHYQESEKSIGIYYIEDCFKEMLEEDKKEVDLSSETPMNKEIFKTIENGFEEIFEFRDKVREKLFESLTSDLEIKDTGNGKLNGEILREKDYLFINSISFGLLGITKNEEVRTITVAWNGMTMQVGGSNLQITETFHLTTSKFPDDISKQVIGLQGFDNTDTHYLLERGTIDKYIPVFDQTKEMMNKTLINI